MTNEYGQVQRRVRAQAEWIAVAAFSGLLPAVLLALLVASGWTAYVNVAAIHTYIAKEGSLPGSSWGVPVAIQIAILAGEATMVLDAILRRWWILIGGAAMAVGGYAVEITMHVKAAESDTWALVVAAVACGGGWALTAGLMHRGVEIANEAEDVSKPLSSPVSKADVEVTREPSRPVSKPMPVIVSKAVPVLSPPPPRDTKQAIAAALKNVTLDIAVKAFKAPDDESVKPQADVPVPPPAVEEPKTASPAPRPRPRVTAKAVSRAASVTAKISTPKAARARRERAARDWWKRKASGDDITKSKYAEEIGMSRTTLDIALTEFPAPEPDTVPAAEPVGV